MYNLYAQVRYYYIIYLEVSLCVFTETPLVGLFPMPPTNSSNYNFEEHRIERVQCVFAAPSADLSGSITITKINSTGSFTSKNTFFYYFITIFALQLSLIVTQLIYMLKFKEDY